MRNFFLILLSFLFASKWLRYCYISECTRYKQHTSYNNNKWMSISRCYEQSARVRNEMVIPLRTDDISHPRHIEWTPNTITFARDTLKAQIRITHFVVFVLLFRVISRCFIGVPCVCVIVAGEKFHLANPLARE